MKKEKGRIGLNILEGYFGQLKWVNGRRVDSEGERVRREEIGVNYRILNFIDDQQERDKQDILEVKKKNLEQQKKLLNEFKENSK
jgi:hypothetical protein